MGLSAEDLQAIGSLMDSKLSAVQAADRRRRRWWFWFWVLFFVLSTIVSWYYAEKYLVMIKEQIARVEDDFRDAKVSYQTDLAKSPTMQAERKQVEAISGYDGTKSQAAYESELLARTISLISKSKLTSIEGEALSDKHTEVRSQQDTDDALDDLNDYTERLSGTIGESLSLLNQIMLRNTDPALNSPDENLLLGETAGQAPVNAPAPTPAPTTTAPPRIYTPPE